MSDDLFRKRPSKIREMLFQSLFLQFLGERLVFLVAFLHGRKLVEVQIGHEFKLDRDVIGR